MEDIWKMCEIADSSITDFSTCVDEWNSFFPYLFFFVASVNDAAWIHPQSQSRNNNNNNKIIPPTEEILGGYLGSHQEEYFLK